MKEQFAGWGLYDNSAICLTCGHQHLIPKAEQITEQPWLDWLAKHPGHETFIIPEKLLSRLGQRQAELLHNADVKVAYGSSGAYTITLASLASDSNLLTGRESNALDNGTNKYLDELVSGFITSGTSPAAGSVIEVQAIGCIDDTPTWPDVFDGTDSGETITAAEIKNALVNPIAYLGITGTSNISYPFRPVGLRQMFGDALPKQHVIFVTQNTSVNLNSTGGNHAIKHTPIYETVI
jgi:hypothetical protein